MELHGTITTKRRHFESETGSLVVLVCWLRIVNIALQGWRNVINDLHRNALCVEANLVFS